MDYLKASHDFGIINRRSQTYVTEICKPWNLSYSEYIILMSLYIRSGCQQNELGKAIKADKALVARCVKTLEEKGFLFRNQSEQDRRVKYIYLTEKAWSLQGTMENILKKWVEALVQGIDEHALDKALDIMHAVAENAAHADIPALGPVKEIKL